MEDLAAQFLDNFEEKLKSLGVGDDYRELLVANVKQQESTAAKVRTAVDILNAIEDELTIAPLLERFKGTTADDWR